MSADDEIVDDPYFEKPSRRRGSGFDADLIRESVTGLPVRDAIVLAATNSVTEAMRAMQREHRGCVLVTDDGTTGSKLLGIFTERDVLFRIVDRGKNPATLPLGDVMTPDPEVIPLSATVAYALPALDTDQPVMQRTGARRLESGVVVCGDYLATPSIQGAMSAGRRAAELVLEARAST